MRHSRKSTRVISLINQPQPGINVNEENQPVTRGGGEGERREPVAPRLPRRVNIHWIIFFLPLLLPLLFFLILLIFVLILLILLLFFLLLFFSRSLSFDFISPTWTMMTLFSTRRMFREIPKTFQFKILRNSTRALTSTDNDLD